MVYSEKCCNAEGVCVFYFDGCRKDDYVFAVSSTYWLNKVSLCQRASVAIASTLNFTLAFGPISCNNIPKSE